MTTKKPIVRIYTGDGEYIDREMNDVEYEQHLKDVAEYEAQKAEAKVKAQAKAELLQRLKISEEEARLLLS